MRRQWCLFLLLLLLGPPLLAQQSASNRITQSTITAGGHPSNGAVLSSASHKLRVGTIGQTAAGGGLSSASFELNGGFVISACHGREETCDRLDENCDGTVDEGFDVGAECQVGVGACLRAGLNICTADHRGTACDALPGQPSVEACNGIDDDCDGSADEGLPSRTWYRDADNDGYGDPSLRVVNCEARPPTGYVAQGGDCQDTAASVHPGATEICNSIDDDCDSTSDDGFDAGTACSEGVGTCLRSGHKVCTSDHLGTICDAVPGQPSAEVCNGLDDDCDGAVDDGLVPRTWYRDTDNDGYGDPLQTVVNCDPGPPAGYVAQGGDCNDTRGSVHPGAAETCSRLDDDCDGSVDEGFDVGTTCSAGVGSCQRTGQKVCTQDQLATVCDAVPGQPSTEQCNGADDDCDGTVDEGCCTLDCSAVVPGSSSGSGPVAFQANANVTGTNCTGTPFFAWKFGDGGSATGLSVTHTYSAAGTFGWTLTVTWQDKVCTRSGMIAITKNLAITSPSTTGQYETGSLTVSLSGTATEPLRAAPTWRNERTGRSGKTKLGAGKTIWSASKVALAGGENAITVNGIVGTTAASDRIVVVADDHAGPSVTVKSPRANSTSNRGTIKLSGKATDAVGVASVDYKNLTTGSGGRCKGTTSWSATGVSLTSGANAIAITATDGAGNTRTVNVMVTYQP